MPCNIIIYEQTETLLEWSSTEFIAAVEAATAGEAGAELSQEDSDAVVHVRAAAQEAHAAETVHHLPEHVRGCLHKYVRRSVCHLRLLAHRRLVQRRRQRVSEPGPEAPQEQTLLSPPLSVSLRARHHPLPLLQFVVVL